MKYFKDVPKMVATWLKEQWSLGPGKTPNVEYIPEKYIVNARVGSIFVYPTSRHNTIASTNYEYLQRTSMISIKISNRFRDDHYEWCEEVYRILYANRRKGVRCMDGWEYLEVVSDRQTVDLSGWYSTTIDVKFITNSVHLDSTGLGDTLNKKLGDTNGDQS